MQFFEVRTAGESHGPGLTVYIGNVPAGFFIDIEKINEELARRQKGYGRGGRMAIENDRVQILAGIRKKETTGSPIVLFIENKDYQNWKEKETEPLTRPRPGHADLVGGIKYQRKDLRDILERSSARETAARVAAGSIAKQILQCFNIEIASLVEILGGIGKKWSEEELSRFSLKEIQEKTEKSPLRFLDTEKEEEACRFIDQAKEEGNTLGGTFILLAEKLPPALGSFNQPENKLDARIAAALIGLQAIKGVEFGIGFEYAYRKGKDAQDAIFYEETRGFYRKTNYAGGIEGGMSNGERIFIKAVMKPIPTLMSPLASVDIQTKQPFEAVKERSDITAVPAAAVVGESLLAIEITRAFLERYGLDNKAMIERNWLQDLRKFEWLNN